MPHDDTPTSKRSKKSDKAKEKHERNGSFSQKHIRISEELKQKCSHFPRPTTTPFNTV
jgi:hypothetical protein